MPDRKRTAVAGSPSITPEIRIAIEKTLQHRDQVKATLRHKVACDEATTAPDAGGGRILDVTDAEVQEGRPLSGKQIMEKLQKLNPCLRFEVSNNYPHLTGIYAPGLDEYSNVAYGFVCGMESNISPEFSIRQFEDSKIPDPENPGEWKTVKLFVSETRGWRTVVARLIREGIIEKAGAEREFQITQGRDSRNWQTLVN